MATVTHGDGRTNMQTDGHTPQADGRTHRLDTARGESTADLLKALRDETTTLLRQEVALAKQEMSEKTSKIARNSGYLAAGGMAAYAGATVLLFAIAAGVYALLVEAGLSNMMAGWLAPLLVGLVVMIIGYSMMKKGISAISETSLVPERTVETLQQDKEWIKRKVTS